MEDGRRCKREGRVMWRTVRESFSAKWAGGPLRNHGFRPRVWKLIRSKLLMQRPILSRRSHLDWGSGLDQPGVWGGNRDGFEQLTCSTDLVALSKAFLL